MLLDIESHPTWVCGLKLSPRGQLHFTHESHPTWVCGLKQESKLYATALLGHTLRGCVD